MEYEGDLRVLSRACEGTREDVGVAVIVGRLSLGCRGDFSQVVPSPVTEL